jgi:hypothetical protein
MPLARADIYRQAFWDQHTANHVLKLSPELSYDSTATNFNADGETAAPAGLTSLHTIQLNTTARYGLSPKFTGYGIVNWQMLSLDAAGRQSSAYGFGDQSIGLSYRVTGGESKLAFDLQLQADIATYDNEQSRADNIPVMGDQSKDVTFGGFLHWVPLENPEAKLALTGGGGYRYRSDGYSADLPWSIHARYLPKQTGWIAGIRLYGSRSLNKDEKTRGLVRAAGSGTGGSLSSEADNAGLAWAGIEVGYQIDPAWAIRVHGNKTVYGTNIADRALFAIAVDYRLDPSPRTTDPAKMLPDEYGKSNKGFLEYTFEAKVKATNDRLNMIKIDKGSESGLATGQVLDVFRTNSQGEIKDAVARARVKSVKEGEAVLSVTEYFKEVWIEEGFIVKKPLE